MKYILMIAAAFSLTACVENNSSQEKERIAQELIQQQSQAVVGMPAITRFREKKLLKMIYEMRDAELSTITYFIDINGSLHKLCDSVGYGIPYATQYTSPQTWVRTPGNNGQALGPQADPNGLFSPAAADGTWIMCSDGKGSTKPVFFEPRVIVSPFPLK